MAAPLPSKQLHTSSLATHFTAASRQQKGKQRRSSEVASKTPLKSGSQQGQDLLLERQPAGLAVKEWSNSAHDKAALEIAMDSLPGGQHSSGEVLHLYDTHDQH